MQNHDHPTITHLRAEKRKHYASFYVCVRADAADARCAADGRLLAWSFYGDALKEANCSGMIVVSWTWFLAHYLNRLPVQPKAAQLRVKSKRGTKFFHAEFDATPDELRTLNIFYTYEMERRPGRGKSRTKIHGKAEKALKNAKVWPEDAAA
jgi:hypothetical protein